MARASSSWRWWTILIVGFVLAGLASSFILFSGPLPFLAGVVLLVVRERDLRANGSLLAVAVAAAANAFNLGASLWFFGVRAGLSIRPMIWNAQVLLVSVIAVLLVLLLGFRTFFREGRLKQPLAALALAIGSLLVAWGVLHIAESVRGFTVATD